MSRGLQGPFVHSVSPIDEREVQGHDGEQVDEASGVKEAGREDEDDIKDLDEARKAAVMRRPYTPTQKEIEDHLPLHLPYRSWCPHCVAGKGVGGHHKRGTSRTELVSP